LNLLCSAAPAEFGGLAFDSIGLVLLPDTWVGEATPRDAGVIVSSPEEATFFTRSEPLSLLKRELSFDELLLFSFVSDSASRLCVVETSFGIEISLGSTRLRMDDECDSPCGKLTDDEVLFSATIAASAFFWTSRTRSACSDGDCGTFVTEGLR